MNTASPDTAVARATLEAWIRDAAARMDAAGLVFGHGTAEAIDEACWMGAHVLGLPPDFDDEAFGRRLDDAQRRNLDRLLEQRIGTRKPLAYLIGEAWFAGLAFDVDGRVLVPRSPIAEMIIEGFAPWVEIDRVARMVDVGTGSGCLAVAAAVHWPHLVVDALDVDAAALEVAAGNVRRHGVGDRVRVLQSDLLSAVAGERYDLIVSNPPYVAIGNMAALPDEYRHEPEVALASGAQGLDDILDLLRQAPDCLTPGGCLVMEVGEAAGALIEALPETPFIWLEFRHGGEGVFVLDTPGCETAAREVEKLDGD